MSSNYFRLIHRKELVIFREYSVPIPMSHPMQGELAVKKWMVERGMQGYCKVVSEEKFKQLGGKSDVI